jgi:crossover junction endodeoxyribonuclease RuvC
MIIMGIDPGAKRLGLSVLEKRNSSIEYIDSKIVGLERGKLAYQEYKVALISFMTDEGDIFISKYKPDIIVAEMVPVQGFSNSAQAQLAACASICFLSVGSSRQIKIEQISAIRVKKLVTGNAKATKTKIKKAVLEQFPKLEYKKQEWKIQADEADAIAIALAYCQ